MVLPIWIYFVIAGIIFSGLMALKSGKEERELEEAWIEKEGNIYLERMEKEREERDKYKQTV
ncbi:SigE-dependent sporulation protein [Bacillus coahuilensis m2-6]|uniref:SigE-dependent sporulation protein n=1 Tax=Bacillus coahuilensis p1.1.43 TaxID=1150625 RepID=A0A147KB04_9BACI|nr:sporulation YhaL family protein [Bacillus coahuilensis]KUP07944.1 SigE-dependent sporulation protein [Bacillus coahuilensis p1.1.43]KUP09351.1 SigE-dependent sporulation protein [Bacillus coahuilensis m2-6]